MFKVKSSRPAEGLKPGDYDHEISLEDHDRATSLQPVALTHTLTSGEEGDMQRVSTTSPLLPASEPRSDDAGNDTSRVEREGDEVQALERPTGEVEHEQGLPHPALRPAIEVQEPTPGAFHGSGPHVVPKKPQVQRETAIDILYENERGGFLCGSALFSSKALGSLDPSPWTNAYHKCSPTSVQTATVPDPSWEWVWPEWHINHEDKDDEGGWEYSFAFSNKFSWHKAKWWNSFVRRRAWIRKRARKVDEDISTDPHMLNTEYFSVLPASELHRQSYGSLSLSRVTSRASRPSSAQAPSMEMAEEKPDIEDINTLIQTLRVARIDREKLDAAENYLQHATDLSQLQEEMHEIMSLFVFQASRRILLSRLMQIYDETTTRVEEHDEADLKERQEALKAAIKHADEEVRKLAYWSDVKQMAESGESHGAVDTSEGWRDEWEGVDQSGPSQPNSGQLPGP